MPHLVLFMVQKKFPTSEGSGLSPQSIYAKTKVLNESLLTKCQIKLILKF